jgi:hypothetical protein
MSKYMLSDEDTMNDINPYVERDFSVPGYRRNPNLVSFEDPVDDDVSEFPVYERSPACDTVSKTVGRIMGPSKSCAYRSLYEFHPQRNIDEGDVLWLKEKQLQRMELVEETEKQRMVRYAVNVFILISLLLLVSRF